MKPKLGYDARLAGVDKTHADRAKMWARKQGWIQMKSSYHPQTKLLLTTPPARRAL